MSVEPPIENSENQNSGAIIRPAEGLAQQAEREAEEAIEKAKLKAALDRANPKFDDQTPNTEKKSASDQFAPAAASGNPSPPSIEEPANAKPDGDTQGRRRVTHGDQHIFDCGDHIHIPGIPTRKQLAMAGQLAQSKGWTHVVMFDSGGVKQHAYAPHAQQIMASYVHVVTDPNAIGTLKENRPHAAALSRQKMLAEQAARTQAPVQPA